MELGANSRRLGQVLGAIIAVALLTIPANVGLQALNNKMPEAHAGSDQHVDVFEEVFFDASGSLDPDGGGISEYKWFFGDGKSGYGRTISHMYSTRGHYTVQLRVTDNKGGEDTDTMIVYVNDVPVAVAGFIMDGVSIVGDEILVDVGENIQFDGSNSHDPDGTIYQYEWIFADGMIGEGISPVHSYEDEGIRRIILIVTDNNGSKDSDFIRVVVHNDPPIPDADADIVTYEDTPVTFDGSGTWDTTLDFPWLTYEWDFGDGNTGTDVNPIHTYTQSGFYFVHLTVTDNESCIREDDLTVLVKNVAPQAAAGSDVTVNEDDAVAFSGIGTDTASDQSILDYHWDFDDESTGSGASTSHLYPKSGTYIATLKVTDNDGESDCDTLIVTVNNVAPVVDAGIDKTSYEDELLLFHASATDTPSDSPTLTYEWDFGDGTYTSGKTVTYNYQNNGVYDVTLTVTDDDGASDQDIIIVTVENNQPAVYAGQDMVVNKDDEIIFNGRAFDTPSDIQSLSFNWDFGDSTTGSGPDPNHIYSNQGVYFVTLDIWDDDLLIGTDSLVVTVENLKPRVNPIMINPPFPTVLENDVVEFSGSGVDTPSDQPTLSFSWDFGDGKSAIGTNVNHEYVSSGIYTITLTVTDDDGASDATNMQLFVHRHSFDAEITGHVDILVGETATYIITIKNTGTLDDCYDLILITSIDPTWLSFPTSSISVPAGAIRTLLLQITPFDDFPLDNSFDLDFELLVVCGHDPLELNNAPLMKAVSNSVTIMETYESRLRWAQAEVESLITDFSGGNPTDATLLKALEEVSEALFFSPTRESPEFDFVKSFEHVKEGIHNLEMVSSEVTTDYIINLLITAVNDRVEDTIMIAEIQAGADNLHVVDAWALYAEAQDRIAIGDYENGMEQYKNAHMEAERAEGEWVPREYISALLEAVDDINNLLSGPYSAETLDELQQAKDELIEALDKADYGLHQDSFVNVKNAVVHLLNAGDHGAPTSDIVVALTETIEEAVKMLIIETETHVGMEVNDIKQAWNKFHSGQHFANNGQYLQAIDKYDRAYTHALLAEDWIPIADAGPDQLVTEDDIVYLDASNSRDRDGIVLFYEWDFADGTTDSGVFLSHSFSVAGTYTIILKVTDNEGLIDLDFIVVTVENTAPIIEAGDDRTAIEDEIILFKADYTDTPPDIPDLIFSWDFGDGTFGSGVYVTHSYLNTGTYTVILTVTDMDGSFTTDTLLVNVINPIPKADADFHMMVNEDEQIIFEGFGSDTPSDMPYLSYYWDFDDGTSAFGALVTHTYSYQGIYDVILTVTDDNGDIGTYTVYVTVLNVPPSADAGWIQQVYEDDIVYFTGTGVDTISDQSLLIFEWDFGDGNLGSGENPTHIYTTTGVYTVSLTVTDDDGDYSKVYTTIMVEDVPPTADAGSDITVLEDETITFTGVGDDTTSDIPSLTYSWDFGDGSIGSGPSPTHVYSKSGIYIVTLTVTDDDGATSKDALTMTVNNDLPTADSGEDISVNEDDIVLFSGIGGDTPTDSAILKYHWEFDDTLEPTICNGKSGWHRFESSGTYYVTLTVEDDDLATASDTVELTVNNVAPTAEAGPDLFIFAGIVPIQFAGIGFDTPSDEPYLTYHWDFGDGSTSDLRNPIHYYTGDGTYTVTLTVTDDDGTIGQDTATIEVYIDSDGDGMSDSWEIKHKLDPYDPTGENGAEGDPDTDDLYNIYEFWADTDPRDRDTDDDSYYSSWEKINYWNFEDGPEVWYWMAHDYSLIEAGRRANIWDTDFDDIPDGWEEWWGDGRHPGSPIDPDDDIGHAGHDGDPDVDGMINYNEYRYDCNPLDPDTDHDGLPDGVEDKNSNGQWDCYPGVDYNGGNETHAHLPDTDYDGLLDGQEDINKNGTKEFNEPDPTDPDTDDDGILDGNHNHVYVIKIKSIEKLGGGFGNLHLMINDEGLLPYNGYRVPESGDWSVTPTITFSTPEIVAVAFYIDSLPIEVMDNSGTNIGGVLTLSTNAESSEIILSNGEVKLILSCEKEEYGFHDPNPVFPDADFDNITDMPEAIYFSGRCRDFRVNDSDGDNLCRILNDGYIMCNNLVDSDSDGDGILDGDEINSLFPTDPMREDSDDDGRVDPWELDNLILGRPTNPDSDSYHNAIDSDSDDDGLKDGPEYEYWTNRDDGISWDYDSDKDGYINILDQDSDNDTLYDGVEITEYDISVTIASSTTVRTVSSDPAIPDTDSDGFGDYEERYAGEDSFITDPTDPDTDDDGLLDSGEQYITSYETDTRYSVPDKKSGKAGKVEIPLSNIKSYAPESRIYHVEARIGISHSCVSDLKLTLDNGVRSIVIRNFLGGGDFVHEDYDLIAAGFPASDLTTERTWKLKVEDHWDDDVGNIESFEIHIFVRTDPKNDDQDSDGLNDSEEVTLGTYGWLTEPYVADTDGDTLSDGDEVLGTTKGVPTNPTNPDTDADGYNDKEDLYPLHNVGVKVTVLYMIIDSGMDDSDHQPVEPQAVVTIEGKTFCTHIGLGTYFTIYYHYTVDVLDDATTATVIVEAWEDDGQYDDSKLDVKPGDGKAYTLTYTLGSIGNSQTITTSGDSGGIKDATIAFKVETVALPRVNTILINSTDVGIYVTPNDELRYTGEQRFYICYLDVKSPHSDPFVSGLNVIIIPRTTYVDSLFNQSIIDNTLPSDFDGLQVTGFDEDKDTTLGAVVGTVFGELTGTQASKFLDYLIYEDTTKTLRSAYHHLVTEELSTLGVSNEVLKYIPYEINNFPSYSMPNPDDEPEWWEKVWNAITGTLEAITDFIVGCLVAFYNFLEHIGEILEDIGQAILNFLSDPAGAIQAALEAVIDFLNALINWVIDWVTGMIQSVFQPIVDGITNAIEGYANTLNTLLTDAISQEENGIPIDTTVGNIVDAIFGGSLFTVMMVIGTILYGITLAITPFTFTFSFLIGLVVDLALTTVLSSIGGSILGGDYSGILNAALTGNMEGVIDSLGGVVSFSGIIVSVIGAILALIAAKKKPEFASITGLIVAIVGTLVAIYFTDLPGMIAGACLAAFGVYLCKKGPSINTNFDKASKYISWGCLITSIAALIV